MGTHLRNSTGSLYLTIDYDADNHWVCNTWSGAQSFAGMSMGADATLHALQKHRCGYLLNDGRQVVGPWDHIVPWMFTDWLPRALAQGLTHLAIVVSPEALAARPAEPLPAHLGSQVQLRVFEEGAAAHAWLHEAQASGQPRTVAVSDCA